MVAEIICRCSTVCADIGFSCSEECDGKGLLSTTNNPGAIVTELQVYNPEIIAFYEIIHLKDYLSVIWYLLK
jgi:hypothetical protein